MEDQETINNDDSEPRLSREEALLVLTVERDKRLKACRQDLDAVLTKHGCRIIAEPRIQNGTIVAVVHLLVNE